MTQVRWSLTAGNDLQGIEEFIARDSVLHAITLWIALLNLPTR